MAAMRVFQFGDGEDPEELFRAMAPRQLLSAVNQLISFLSMPFGGRDFVAVPAEIERILADELRWLRSTIGDSTDAKVTAERLGMNLGKGLDMDVSKISPGDEFKDGARLQARNALYFSWIALPDARRTPAEAERIVRMAISRELSLIDDIRSEFL